MITRNIAKFVVAVVLTVATVVGGGVVGQEIGLNIASAAYAGDNCGTASGGGC